MVLLWAACAPRGSAAEQESAEAPGITRIESNVPVAPPGWAALERRLIDVLSRAALDYTARYTRSGGTLIWKTSGGASLDDLPESFYNLPLLYALGGDARSLSGNGTPPRGSLPTTSVSCTTSSPSKATGFTWARACCTSISWAWRIPRTTKTSREPSDLPACT